MNTPGQASPWVRRIRTVSLVLAAAVSLYALIGFLILPALLASRITVLVADCTSSNVRLGQLRLKPFALSVRIRGFEIAPGSGDRLLELGEAYANFEARSLFDRAYTFREIRLTDPKINLHVDPGGSLNVVRVFSSSKKPDRSKDRQEGSSHLPPIVIQRARPENGELCFEDQSKPTPFRLSLRPVTFTLENITTLVGSGATYLLEALTEREEAIRLEGSASLAPLKLAGTFKISGLLARTLWSYSRDRLNFDIPAGHFELNGGFSLALSDEKREFRVADGRLQLADLQVLDHRGSKVLTASELTAAGIEFDLFERRLQIRNVNGRSVELKAVLDPSGHLNLTYLAERPSAKNTRPPSAPEQDRSAVPNATADLRPSAADSGVRPGSATDETGVPANGTGVEPEPATSPPAASRPGDTVQPGSEGARASAQETNSSAVPEAGLEPAAGPQNQSTAHTGPAATPLASPETESAANPGASASPPAATEVAPAPDTTVSPGVAPPLAPPEPVSPVFQAEIKRIELQGSTIALEDQRLEHPVQVTLSRLNLTVEGLRPGTGNPVALAADTTVNDNGTLGLKGTVSLKPVTAALQLQSGGIPLQPFQPYVARFAHLDLRSGTVGVAGEVSIHSSDSGTAASFAGNLTSADLHVLDTITNEDFLRWRGLDMIDIRFNQKEGTLSIKEVFCRGPYLRFLITPDQKTNLSHILVKSEGDKTGPAKDGTKPASTAGTEPGGAGETQPATHAKPLSVTVEKIGIEAAASDFSDLSLKPNFRVGIHDLKGTLTGLSSGKPTVAKLNLLGKAETEKLNTVAAALMKRPDLKLEIRGAAAPEADQRALAEKGLQEKLQAKIKGSKTDDPEAKRLRKLYEQTFDDDPEDLLSPDVLAEVERSDDPELDPRVFEAARERLLKTIPVSEDDLRNLARARGEAIQYYLAGQGVPAERLFLLDFDIAAQPSEGAIRATLSLQA